MPELPMVSTRAPHGRYLRHQPWLAHPEVLLPVSFWDSIQWAKHVFRRSTVVIVMRCNNEDGFLGPDLLPFHKRPTYPWNLAMLLLVRRMHWYCYRWYIHATCLQLLQKLQRLPLLHMVWQPRVLRSPPEGKGFVLLLFHKKKPKIAQHSILKPREGLDWIESGQILGHTEDCIRRRFRYMP